LIRVPLQEHALVYAVIPENRCYVTMAVHCNDVGSVFFFNRSRSEINSGNSITWIHAYTCSSVKTILTLNLKRWNSFLFYIDIVLDGNAPNDNSLGSKYPICNMLVGGSTFVMGF
jgi:hypothetical protein